MACKVLGGKPLIELLSCVLLSWVACEPSSCELLSCVPPSRELSSCKPCSCEPFRCEPSSCEPMSCEPLTEVTGSTLAELTEAACESLTELAEAVFEPLMCGSVVLPPPSAVEVHGHGDGD